MSVTSVTTAPPTPYGVAPGNSSRSAKYAALADQLQGEMAAPANDAAKAGVQGNARDVDYTDDSRFQSAFGDALRGDGTAAAGSKSEASSEAGGAQTSAGLALYKRVSQIGNNEFSPSALLKSWNSIMQDGEDEGGAGAATLKAFLQSGASGYGAGILDVTA